MTSILLSVGLNGAFAACEAPVDVAELSAAWPRAQLAMGSLDSEAFAGAVKDARAALPCLTEPLTPIDAAGYHGLMALAAFADGRGDEAVLSFASAVAAMPDYRLPAMIAPPGGDLDALLERARAMTTTEPKALPPYDGVLMVDGARSVVRPTGRPWILQLVDPRGGVRETHYLLGSDPTPPYDSPPTLVGRLVPEPRPRPSLPFAVAAGTTTLAAGGAYALGALAHARFSDQTTPYADLPGLQTQTNLALGGSIVLAAAAAMLTTLTFLEW
jgi:hypothetical protein